MIKMIIVHNDQEITNVEKLTHTTFKLNNQDGVTFSTSFFPVLQAVIILNLLRLPKYDKLLSANEKGFVDAGVAKLESMKASVSPFVPDAVLRQLVVLGK